MYVKLDYVLVSEIPRLEMKGRQKKTRVQALCTPQPCSSILSDKYKAEAEDGPIQVSVFK